MYLLTVRPQSLTAVSRVLISAAAAAGSSRCSNISKIIPEIPSTSLFKEHLIKNYFKCYN